MARVVPIGDPQNQVERDVIAHLRDNAPDSWTVIHNFELPEHGTWYEVDLAVLTPRAVFLVDVKGVHGRVEVNGRRWYPQFGAPYASPLLKLRQHARAFKSRITEAHPARPELRRLYVGAAVILGVPGAHLVDRVGDDEPDVTTRARCVPFLDDPARVPERFNTNAAPLLELVRGVIEGRARRPSGPPRFNNWEVVERLSTTDVLTEYRARNVYAGSSAGTVLLRVYHADPYLPEDERAEQRFRISNAYQALSRLPPHPNIVGAKDFFPTEAEDRFVLVLDDVPARALRLLLTNPAEALTVDQRLAIGRGMLAALAHAHSHGVVHRALSPDTVLVHRDGRALLTGFDYARPGSRTRSLAELVPEEVDAAYLAPEWASDPASAGPAADVFAAGVVLWELMIGERPFADAAELRAGVDLAAIAAQQAPHLPDGLPAWLASLCGVDATARPAAGAALRLLERLSGAGPAPDTLAPLGEGAARDWTVLRRGDRLTRKLIVSERLGRPGGFGVAYRTFDLLADVERVVKVIYRDRVSNVERLKREYRALLALPPHPNLVRVIDADFLPGDGPPYLVFEHVDGFDVEQMAKERALSPNDALRLGREVAAGLAHLHSHGVYHCDIKPSNLLWTDHGTRIIDFNVAVLADETPNHGGGSSRYLPPDLDLRAEPGPDRLADRDVYALGITLYECLAGRYPWDPAAAPPPGQWARDPRELTDLADLAPRFAQVLLRATAPHRADRYPDAAALLADLSVLSAALAPRVTAPSPPGRPALPPSRPNTNPYVDWLRTAYSQSRSTNSGTRGLDEGPVQVYVETALDSELLPAVLGGEVRLVVITGNAGDGKTAFLQRLARRAQEQGADVKALANGSRFELGGRTFVTSYDGSQDEEDQRNDAVLESFFGPFAGQGDGGWPADECRLIAINEGRLVDFLESRASSLGLLSALIRAGLAGGEAEHGVAIVNLNLRSVVAQPASGEGGTLLERMLRRMVDPGYWDACRTCDLFTRCYAAHNAGTFQDPVAAPHVTERLLALYRVTHLRGRLHVTLRDIRSALSFMLVGDRDCDEIHGLYREGRAEEIARSLYFNSWMGGGGLETGDRLLAQLAETDPGSVPDPRLDRRLDFSGPGDERALLPFERRGDYDRRLLSRLFGDLQRTGEPDPRIVEAHRQYLAMARRRFYFESRGDEGWRRMVPYRSAWRMLGMVLDPESAREELPWLVASLNRGEGITEPARLGNSLALRVRDVERGTIRSYRLFEADRLRIEARGPGAAARFVEHAPDVVLLRYAPASGPDAVLRLDLDLLEMLHRSSAGYLPTVEEAQGYAVNLAVFKHALASLPYQEVLLTVTGRDFHRIARQPDGVLRLDALVVTPTAVEA